MAIVFNNIPTTVRTPGVYAEIDNSRALKGLVQNPHKALIIGQKASSGAGVPLGTASYDTLYAITRDGLADGFFGAGSILARMCNTFKDNNPNTELYAMCIGSGVAGTAAQWNINFSNTVNYSMKADGLLCLMINGKACDVVLTSAWSAVDVASAVETTVNGSANSDLPVRASLTAGASLRFSAVCSGSAGNYIDLRFNYYNGQTFPSEITSGLTVSTAIVAGATNPSLADVWAVIDDMQFQYIIHPYATDTTAMTSLETELLDRSGALINQMGHGFGAARATAAGLTTLGNARNSPYSTIMGMYDSPTDPAEVAAALGAVAAQNLNIDPARPLHFLPLKGVLPPPVASRFTRAERDVLLYDGIATSIVDSGGNVCIERCITTYQANALGLPDPSYLDIQTMATLSELRYQFATRMANRFLIPRFKLADDGFPVLPGQFIATPRTIRAEIVALFALMRDKGWIENLDNFITNLVVERDTTDVNRVNVLLPPDLINQFRVLAGRIEFIL